MAYINIIPKKESITGTDCTGSDATANRTYVLDTATVVDYSLEISINGTILHEGAGLDYTLSSLTVTFLNIIDNSDIISIGYWAVSTATAVSPASRYATSLQFVQMSGLGLRIVDEVIGTGDDLAVSYDLDHDNIITDSYVLSYAVSGSNSFTALTETTHYILDKESGRILLTTAGKTALGTKILYGTYWYTDEFSDSVIVKMLSISDEEIDILTGKKWDTAVSAVEYYSGKSASGYPTTDEPFQRDWDAPDNLILKHNSVTKISAVYFLGVPVSVGLFYNYSAGTATYTDKTGSVNYSTVSPFVLFDAVNDYVYIGSGEMFLGLDVNLSVNGTGSPAIDWEYYNGTDWTDMTETGASTFKASGKFTWSYPYGWSKTTVNAKSYYWIRGKLTTGYTISPQCATITILDSISSVLEPRDYLFKENGVLYFMNQRVLNGIHNIRVDYYYGQTTTPGYITELSIIISALKAYINLTGGSYDNATSYTIGSKAVTIGEQYVNIREVMVQFKKRVEDILDMIGRRNDIGAI